MSDKHLERYADEFVFRWNNLEHSAAERMDALIQGSFGRALAYKALVAGGTAKYIGNL